MLQLLLRPILNLNEYLWFYRQYTSLLTQKHKKTYIKMFPKISVLRKSLYMHKWKKKFSDIKGKTVGHSLPPCFIMSGNPSMRVKAW